MAGLNTFQLTAALEKNPITKKCFDGVYPRDILKSIKKTPQMIIVNTDPSTKSGKHWILLYFDAQGHAEIFDSLGNDVASYHSSIKKFIQRHYTHYMHAVHDRIQPKGTTLCGHYCLYYAYLDVRGCLCKKLYILCLPHNEIKSCIPILFDIPDIISEYQCCKKN